MYICTCMMHMGYTIKLHVYCISIIYFVFSTHISHVEHMFQVDYEKLEENKLVSINF